jgi:hypothetical protein
VGVDAPSREQAIEQAQALAPAASRDSIKISYDAQGRPVLTDVQASAPETPIDYDGPGVDGKSVDF